MPGDVPQSQEDGNKTPFKPALYLEEPGDVVPTPALTGYRDSVHWSQHAPILIDNGGYRAALDHSDILQALPSCAQGFPPVQVIVRR